MYMFDEAEVRLEAIGFAYLFHFHFIYSCLLYEIGTTFKSRVGPDWELIFVCPVSWLYHLDVTPLTYSSSVGAGN
jgi:hypothetical protein